MQQSIGRVAPAAVLKVVQRGEGNARTLFARAYGHLDPLDGQLPTQLDSVFDLASVSKIFTFTAFFRLATQGLVSVDTSVREVLPAFSGLHPIGGAEDPITKQPVAVDQAFAGHVDKLTVDRDAITFRHLLTHTAGLAAWRGVYREGDPSPPPTPPHSRKLADTPSPPLPAAMRAARIQAIYGYPFIYPPGERLVYSDLGLILLGEAVARLSGGPLDQAVRRLVLEPLEIAGQAWYNPLACGVPGERIAPTEYDTWRARRLLGEVHDENAAGLGGVAGHAGVFATADAVVALGRLYLDGGAYKGRQLVDAGLVAESVREQACDGSMHRGLGWVLADKNHPYDPTASGRDRNGRPFPRPEPGPKKRGRGPGRTVEQPAAGRPPGARRAFGHTGYTGTSLWCDPQRGLVVVLLCNRVYYGRDPEGIARLRPAVYEAVAAAYADAGVGR